MSCIKWRLLESQLHYAIRKKNIFSFHGQTFSHLSSRNLSVSARQLFSNNKTVDNEEREIVRKGQEFSNDSFRSSHDIDQDLIDELYRRKGDGSSGGGFLKTLNRTEYYKQAWQSKLNTMKEQTKLKDAFTERKHKVEDDGDRCENHNGTVHHRDDEAGWPRGKTDHSDPNERLSKTFHEDKDEERDWRLNVPLTRYGKRGRKAFYYTKKITKLGREGKVNEAMQVFDDWMMVQDRVMPSKRTFITLIGIVGRAGYTRKAFQLLRQMKHLGLDPPDHVYTSLFNACANCPMPHYGLKHANALCRQIEERGIPPNPITVMASMKAFALCGDFSQAFQILDESGIRLDVQCFNALLVACAADKQSGFRRALKVWQKLGEYNIRPGHQTYNLLLRCVRDCGVGDVSTFAADFGLNENQRQIPPLDYFNTRTGGDVLLTSGQENFTGNGEGRDLSTNEGQGHGIKHLQAAANDDVPKLLSIQPYEMCSNFQVSSEFKVKNSFQTSKINEDDGNSDRIELVKSPDSSNLGEWWEETSKMGRGSGGVYDSREMISGSSSVQQREVNTVVNSEDPAQSITSVSLSELDSKQGRLALMGGMSSLVSHMAEHGLQPDIRTFTELLACLPNNGESEHTMLAEMEDNRVKPDIDFLNDIMMRRNKRHQGVKEILALISKYRHTPNMRTYAALALTCNGINEAQCLFDDMEAANVEPTVEVISHLIHATRLNFHYKRFLLEKLDQLALKPSHRIIAAVEKSIAITKSQIVAAEKKADGTSFYLSPQFQRSFKTFLKFYQSWLLKTDLYQETHPWERFNDAGAKKKRRPLEVEKSN